MRCKTCNRVIVTKDLTCPHCENGPSSTEVDNEYRTVSKTEEKVQTFSKYATRHRFEGKRGLSAIVNLYRQAFNFREETYWLEYWTQQLFLILVFSGFTVLRLIHIDPTMTLPPIGITVLHVLTTIILVSLLPMISSAVRRLQNAGYSGYLYLLVLIPVIGSFIVLFLTLAPAES